MIPYLIQQLAEIITQNVAHNDIEPLVPQSQREGLASQSCTENELVQGVRPTPESSVAEPTRVLS
jgi:hypothetical protein